MTMRERLKQLLSHSPIHRTYSDQAVVRWFGTPAYHKQMATLFGPGDTLKAVLTWAWFDETAEKTYLAQKPLTPDDWVSGDRLWFIDLVAPFGGASVLINHLRRDARFAHVRAARWGRTFGTGRFQKIGEATRGLPETSGAP